MLLQNSTNPNMANSNLRSDLNELLKISSDLSIDPIDQALALYKKIQEIRSNYNLSILPEIIGEPNAWITPVEDFPFNYRGIDGNWYAPKINQMREYQKNVSLPVEIGPYCCDYPNKKVEPFGAWLYHHKKWCERLCIAISNY